MSLTVDEPASNAQQDSDVKTNYVTPEGEPNVALLQDRTPAWMRSSRGSVLLVFALAVLFLFSSVLPVWHTDLWGHLNYGRWIVSHRAVPTFEPTMELAKGVPFVDIAWLSQVTGYLMISKFGVPGIQFLNALGIVTVGGLLTFAVFQRTNNLGASLLTLVAFYWGSYQQLLVVRPQLFGMVCFALVFVLATAPRWKRWKVVAIPLVFMVWANVHGSFIVGFVALGALTVGRAIDVYLRTRKCKFVFADSQTRGLFLALELSLVAALLNPYGIAAFAEVFALSSNVNLQSLIEWDPLTLRMKQGQGAFMLACALFVVYRLTPRRVTVRELLLLGGLTVGMLWYSRMIVWWAPVVAYYLGLHTAAVWRHWTKSAAPVRVTGGLWTVVAIGIAWIGFAYSPMGIRVVQGPPKDPAVAEKQFRRSVASTTPIDIANYLKRNPPAGLIFNPYEWGDYLQWAGPEGIQVFVNSHAHLIPEEIWQDYLLLSNAGGGWGDRLDRYGLQAVVVNRQDQANLLKGMEEHTGWEKVFSDNRGAVFVRKPVQPKSPEPKS